MFRNPIVRLAVLAGALAAGASQPAAAALPPGNSVQQWNQIAENAVIAAGAFQNEGMIYMAYESRAVYDATLAVKKREGSPRASIDAAVIEAAYDTLVNYFPAQTTALYADYVEALAFVPNGVAKANGQAIGLAAATHVIQSRAGDGRLTPIGTTSPFPTLPAGPGVWRLTPAAYAAPQTPWVGDVKPFVLDSANRFLPAAPPSLSSTKWAQAFDAIQTYGSATSVARTADQTATAKFWTANVIRQYNSALRDLATARSLDTAATARLAAMVNVVGADAQISVMHAKYHYLRWRPVTAIDPTSVAPGGDGFGPVPGYDDGNAATLEVAGWRPLVATPNHPEYPAAHGSLTSAMAEVFAHFLGTDRIELDIHGFDAAGLAGNLDAVRHFSSTADLRREIIDARFFAGLHFRFSSEAGVELGREVAGYDLERAFDGEDD